MKTLQRLEIHVWLMPYDIYCEIPPRGVRPYIPETYEGAISTNRE